jgi:hypothetical protein
MNSVNLKPNAYKLVQKVIKPVSITDNYFCIFRYCNNIWLMAKLMVVTVFTVTTYDE